MMMCDEKEIWSQLETEFIRRTYVSIADKLSGDKYDEI